MRLPFALLALLLAAPALLSPLLAAPALLSPLLAAPALALPPPPAIPAPLLPWVPWVLHAEPDLLCAGFADARACEWPGHLTLRLDDDGGTFALDVWLDKDGVVRLPGDRDAWPQDVKGAALEPAAVQETDGLPGLRLARGHHTVTGRFAWTTVPEVLAVPEETGLVDLALRGKGVDQVRREGNRLFLQQEGGREATVVDTLTATVARKLNDGVPLRVTTRLTLRVAGRARDLVLGRVLLAGSRPVAIQSELPVQVAPDGAVRVHGRPGTHVIDIEAVLALPEHAGAVTKLAVPHLAPGLFAPQETWVWVPVETLRSVDLTGLQPIDPERTQLAADWKPLGRSHLAEPGQVLTLTQTRRGEAEPPPNRIDVVRELWLDLDGTGLTARDRLTGDLHQGWRLDVAPGTELGRVGKNANAWLVTVNPQSKRPGVEVRDGKLDLEADSRVKEQLSDLGAVGWDFDAHSLRATLHLPPGWTLFGASGVDEVPATWLDSWTLFDFFFVLMLALGTGRLLGWRWGLVALLGLALCHGQDEAPEWLWLNALAALALLRVLPPGLFRKAVALWHALAILLLVLALIPFARDQLRHGLQPQVAKDGKAAMAYAVDGRYEDSGGDFGLGMAKEAAPTVTTVASPAPEPPQEIQAAQAEPQQMQASANVANKLQGGLFRSNVGDAVSGKMSASDSGGRKDSSGYLQRKLQQVDPNAVVQTGPGVPRWNWQRLELKWTGPVQKDHRVSLWLVSPRQNLLLAVLRVVLVLLLGLRLLDAKRLRGLLTRLQPPVPTAVLLLAGLLLLGSVQPAQALEGGPRDDVLRQLRERLVQAQACDGPCVVVPLLELRLDGQNATLTAEIHAQRDASWALPGPTDPLLLREVALDGIPTKQLRRQAGGLVAVRVPAGRHVVTVTGSLVRRTVVTVQLDPHALPRRVKFVSTDWAIDGLDEHGVPDNSLQLTRIAAAVDPSRAVTPGQAEAQGPASIAAELPPWFDVERQLDLGLPWQVHTVVRRLDAERPVLAKVPLLPGESVITDGIRVEAGPNGARVALVHFPRDVKEVTYEAELPVAPTLTLTAPTDLPWTETWRLSCSPIWRCSWPTASGSAQMQGSGSVQMQGSGSVQLQGMPPLHTRDPADAALRPTWQPWPGETLHLTVVRPEGAPGQAVTVDSVDYRVTPGQRLLQAVLTLSVRASQGGWRTLTLPEGAEVQTVTHDGKPRTIRPQGRALRLPLEPGAQTLVVRWQQPWQRGLREVAPAVDLGGPAANVQVAIVLGEDRWLLWAHGPDWGPAVLFWSHLALLVLAALALGRLQGPPLRTHQWLLLALGLGQLPAALWLVVVGWFMALAWRRARAVTEPPMHSFAHDVAQVALGGWTLAALGVLYAAIHQNLLGEVDMQVRGAGSSEKLLQWYADRIDGKLPEVGVLSLPLLAWRLTMLAWALWLVWALLGWLQGAGRSFGTGGLWRPLPRRASRVMTAADVVPPPRTDIPPPPVRG